MSSLEILIIALSVSVDAFAVSISGAMCADGRRMGRNALTAALFFGGFQFIMPVAGYFAATLLRGYAAAWDHWLAFALLTLVGGKMCLEGWLNDDIKNKDTECTAEKADFFAVKRMFTPAVATSLDALAVGAGLFFAGSPLLLPAAAMGIVTGAASAAGVVIGTGISTFAKERIMLMIGGSAIILIGIKILLTDLLDR